MCLRALFDIPNSTSCTYKHASKCRQHVHLLGVLASSVYSVCITCNKTLSLIDSPSLYAVLLCWQIVKGSLFVQKGLGELCKSKYGQRIILQLLHPDQQKYVPLHLQQIMHPPSKPASGFAASVEQETEQVRPGLVLCLVAASTAATNPLLFKPSWCDPHNSTSQLQDLQQLQATDALLDQQKSQYFYMSHRSKHRLFLEVARKTMMCVARRFWARVQAV